MKKIMFPIIILYCILLTACSTVKTEPTSFKNGDVVGSGNASFDLTISDGQKEDIKIKVHTDEKTVGDALLALHIVSGKQSEYGLYIESVNGITANFEKDQTYWAFYVDNEYSQKSVSDTEIDPGLSYMLKIETEFKE